MTESALMATWFGAVGQVCAALFAIVAIAVTAHIAGADRRQADQRAAEDRQRARREEEVRWERDLLVRLAVALETPGPSSEARAIVLALGPERLRETCNLVRGEPEEEQSAVEGPLDGLSEWDKARVEVARAMRSGLPPRSTD